MASKNKSKSATDTFIKGGEYKRLCAVTVPTLKTLEDVPIHVKITRPVEIKPKLDKNGAQSVDDDGRALSIDILHCVNLDTGEMVQVVAGKGLTMNLREYDGGNDAYVGRCFEITKHASPAGKRWKPYSVYEIEAPKGEGPV